MKNVPALLEGEPGEGADRRRLNLRTSAALEAGYAERARRRFHTSYAVIRAATTSADTT